MEAKTTPLRVAIAGSGPAAFFCADYLLRLGRPCTVALFERWPYPFGLVRDAVAPDKPKIRAAANAFARMARCPEFSFWGNVTVGKDISLTELKNQYHAVIVATGASTPRPLNIQGNGLTGYENAVSLAGWINGRPDCVSLHPNLSHPSVVIIGAGNAALDMARILASPAAILKCTDISSAAWPAFRDSRVTDIHVVARRGPYDVRFAPQELELLSRVPGCRVNVHADPAQLEPPAATPEAKRMHKAYATAAASQGQERCVHLHYDMNPVALLGDDTVTGVLLENQLEEYTHIACGLVINSTGQVGCPLDELPFDAASNQIPNISGRVVEGETVLSGVYTAGAVKRGANSFIGANKPDCLETVQCIIEDRNSLIRAALKEENKLRALLKERGIRVVTFEDWLRIDAWERQLGHVKDKPRDRLLSTEAMIKALD